METIAAIMTALMMFFSPITGDVIYEDDPRWNCATMGNGVCGTSQYVSA